ncbi:MAG: cystathionine gamma-synthase [Flavobacteriales bacterium]|nr:cystathionine gamma-synthase [Flavobacteriales bacterium]
MKFGTKVIHAGLEPDESTGAIMTPIYQTSTYAQRVPGEHKGYEYSRTQNPTRHALEKNLASLENAKHGLCYSSGMAAIDSIVHLLEPGDEIVSTNDLYGGSFRLFRGVYEKFGIKSHFINLSDIDALQQSINEKTKLIWIETPTNPLLHVFDIQKICEIAHQKNILVCVDNTFATPYLQTPLDLGADLVVHSLTKFIGGHSDVVMGAIMLNDDSLQEKLAFYQNSCGATPGPQDCFLVLRGIKTLHLRVQRHSENGKTIAEYLANHPKVENVFWPGLTDHKNHELAKKQMKDFGGMLSFRVKGADLQATFDLVSKFKLFTLAESLGGVESLAGHPATMTHASIPKEMRDAYGISDNLIRLSVGIEDVEDLVEDIANTLS